MMSRACRIWLTLVCLFFGVLGATPAFAEAPWWHLASSSTPTNLPPGGKGTIVVTATNLGDGAVNGATAPVTITDKLPPGLTATAISGREGSNGFRGKLECSLSSLSCTLAGPEPLTPYEGLEVSITVKVETGASSGLENEATVAGGEAPGVSVRRPVVVSSAQARFGVERYELAPENEGGTPATQAGSHPFQLTTTLALNQTLESDHFCEECGKPIPAALPKDLRFNLPPGLVGNPSVIPQCTDVQFTAFVSGPTNLCPAETAVGVAIATINIPNPPLFFTVQAPLFNLVPAAGEPARFGFVVEGVPVVLDTSVRTGGDYGVTVSVNNISQAAWFLASQVTFWGVPGDPRHDQARGWGCVESYLGLPCTPLGQQHPAPFLTLPTSCTGPLQTTVQGDSWPVKSFEGGSLKEESLKLEGKYTFPVSAGQPLGLDGCNRLGFSSSISVASDGQAASTPTGLTVDVHVPEGGALNPAGLANSNIKDIAVTLPEGVTLNPAAADGLQACSEELVGFTGFHEFEPGTQTLTFTEKLPEPLQQGLNVCPDAAKVGTVTIKSPLLPPGQFLQGAVYLATPAPNEEEGNNPFRSTVALYIVAKDPISGTLVKLPGRVTLDQQTGRISSTFEDTPQLAFEDAEINFFGGERAPLATPAHCGTYTTEATFTPWSGTEPLKSTSSFQITTGPNGTPCPGTLPFAPSLAAGSPNINAGSFSPLTTTISRADGNQNIQTVQLHLAPGMSGILAGVKLCPEAQANAGTCGAESLIGETIVSVGLGGDPFTVTGGKVYLTEKYHGGQFGLSIVNPADAGPFHLGKVIVRAKIEIDPRTAALTITTGNVPHIIDGFPLQIKHVNVNINRPGFTFNPTNCNPMSITGQIGSVEGASSPVSVPFQVTNCGLLKYTPQISVATVAHSSKANGASLLFKIGYPKGAMGSQSWFNEAKFDLPKQLPARLTTIQKACLASTFESNPAACPPASLIGHAIVHTQVLPVPLAGPVYFVSHGGAKFPDAVIVLQGDGVRIDLVGETFIDGKTGVTSATFRNTPDVPFESIEVSIPSGPFSEFGANLPAKAHGSFCGQKLVMPTLFKASNGLEIHQNTPVGVTGCGKALTRAQKLAAALKACHKKHGHKRAACEKAARKAYGARVKNANKGTHNGSKH